MSLIQLVNGPNLNRLGRREPEIYGAATLADIERDLEQHASTLGHRLRCCQSNAESELISAIHAAGDEGVDFIIINPAEPPLIMRDTVYGLVRSTDEAALDKALRDMVRRVQDYVPGYRLVQDPVFDPVTLDNPALGHFEGTKVSVFLEVEGAGDWLPDYAGNLDIMTAAALRMGEEMVRAA